MLFHLELSVISLIGHHPVDRIVKKNAIMMIDFALERNASKGFDTAASIRAALSAAIPAIMMTTNGSTFGGLPLALGTGAGSETACPRWGGDRRRTSRIAVSYAFTPRRVIYLYMDRLAHRLSRGGTTISFNTLSDPCAGIEWISASVYWLKPVVSQC